MREGREAVELARARRADGREPLLRRRGRDELRRARRRRDLDELRLREMRREIRAALADRLCVRVDAPHRRCLALRHELVVHGPDDLAGDGERLAARERIERHMDGALERILHGHETRRYLARLDGVQHLVDVRERLQPPRAVRAANMRLQPARGRLAVRARRAEVAHDPILHPIVSHLSKQKSRPLNKDGITRGTTLIPPRGDTPACPATCAIC